MLLSPQSAAAAGGVDEKQKNGSAGVVVGAVSSSSVTYLSALPPSRPQHIYTPTSSAASVPTALQDSFHNNPTIIPRQRLNTNSSLLSFQSARTPTTSGGSNHFHCNTNGTGSNNIRREHSFDIEQPISPPQHVPSYSPIKRDRLGTVESVVRSLGSVSHRHNGLKHSHLAQQMLGSVAAAEEKEGRDLASGASIDNDDDASDVSSLSDDGTSSGPTATAAASGGGRAVVKKSLLKKSRSIRKKNRSRPGSISGRQTSDQAPSIATSITSLTHTMETIDCPFPSPLTAEINIEKVKSSKDLMGNHHRKCQSSMSGVSFPQGGYHRSSMIHDSWTSPSPGYEDSPRSRQPKKGEDLIDVSFDAPIDPFSGLIGMPSSSISMCDNSFASGTTSSLDKPKAAAAVASSFLRNPAMVARSNSVNSEFDPFAGVKSEVPKAPRYLRDNPLLSKSRYRGRQSLLSSPHHHGHERAPSLDTACMIGSIAMSETSTPVLLPSDSESIVSNIPEVQAPSSVTEAADEDDDDNSDASSYASFTEELNRKDWGKAFVGDVMNFVEKVLPVVGVKPKETKLKRATGCLT